MFASIFFTRVELRTPLNTAFLGLKFLLDEMENDDEEEEDEEAEERRETLMDISVACKTAVDILNDLLCFVSSVSMVYTYYSYTSLYHLQPVAHLLLSKS